MSLSWVSLLKRNIFRRRAHPRRCAFRGSLEIVRLEDRVVPTTIMVSNLNDSGAGSFREAILESNASAGVRDSIGFQTPSGVSETIFLASPLPDITDPVTIDATSQVSYGGSPLIELDGESAGLLANGLHV